MNYNNNCNNYFKNLKIFLELKFINGNCEQVSPFKIGNRSEIENVKSDSSDI